MNSPNPPLVSVIVPVFNDPNGIRACVEALLAQSYPKESVEVIVVDNGSTDSTADCVGAMGVNLVRENDTRGSYAARNKGLGSARGTIIAFTDADCLPSPHWLAEGVRCLVNRPADLVSGPIRFRLSEPPRGAELWDAVTNMQIEENIRRRQVSKTANLLVRRAVFDAIGPFPDRLRSGGDVIWTGRATAAGFHLAYHPPAVIEHPARRLAALLNKQFRVGRGRAAMAREDRSGTLDQLSRIALGLLPNRLRSTRRILSEHGRDCPTVLTLRVWAAAWASRSATALGHLTGLLFRAY